MDERIKRLNERHYRLMSSLIFDKADLDDNILNRHISFLNQLDAVSSGAISVFDLSRREHVYWSSKFETIFGWDMAKAQEEGNAYGDNRVYPEDLIQMLEAGYYFMRFALSIPPDKRKDFKLVTEYRTKGREDRYVRVVEQQSVLELDTRGNLWLALSLLDLSPERDIDAPYCARMINFKTGELYRFPPDEAMEDDPLTMREKEILHLISKGLISREIADMLYISVNTVNTHRQRIIEKLNVSNTFEAIRYAAEIGILPWNR